MDETIVIPGTSNVRVSRRDLPGMAVPEIVRLKDRARHHEMMIEANSAAYLGGQGPDALAWHRIWLWCSVELDRRTTDATVKAGAEALRQIRDVAE